MATCTVSIRDRRGVRIRSQQPARHYLAPAPRRSHFFEAEFWKRPKLQPETVLEVVGSDAFYRVRASRGQAVVVRLRVGVDSLAVRRRWSFSHRPIACEYAGLLIVTQLVS